MTLYKQSSLIISFLFISSLSFTQNINCEKVLTKFFKDHFKIDHPRKNQAFSIKARYINEYNTAVTRDTIEMDTTFSEVVVAHDYYRHKNGSTEGYYDGKEVFLVTHHDSFPAITKLRGQKFQADFYRRGFESFVALDSLVKYGQVVCSESDAFYIASIHFEGEVLLLTQGIDTIRFFIDKTSKQVQPKILAMSSHPKSTVKRVTLTYEITPLNAEAVKAQSAGSFLFENDGSLKEPYKGYRVFD